ncbi:pyridoxamine 5'-phosphate oxidase family protein [Gimesia aquarii]|uniref:Pyridoxamine 5'-phosphate oxidase n=1 Tax=Gimesia aquarii TaxID=2527964 RepID=A0A517WR33_9PLAN|nr:pyridoxamine 5'-phosphate oxidase family protein [Gimesia aquarii]QDU07722.1 Pyridoxamine 5'-phosphate oxidase [Gimesia aquarii]
MYEYPSDIAFTPAVKTIQTQKGSRSTYSKVERGHGWLTEVTPILEEFIGSLDMFYLGTTNGAGQPYIQYRGGSRGFLKVIDQKTLGFADFGGNRQYITLGNLSENPKAFLFLMDYVNSRRIKLWGTAKVVEDDEELINRLHDPEYPAKPERAILFSIEAWDMNCHQHIHRRFSREDILPVIEKLKAENELLKEKVTRLQSALESGR